MSVLAGRPTLVCPCVIVHERTSHINPSLLFQFNPVYLVCQTRMPCEIEGRWPYIYIYIYMCVCVCVFVIRMIGWSH